MGVFDDKKFEQLDWISQATEPIDSATNDTLGKLPDSLDVTFDVFKAACYSSYSIYVSVDRLVAYLLETSGMSVPHGQDRLLRDCFKIEMEGKDVTIDFENQTINGGKIRLVKTASTLDEKVLSSILGKDGIQQVTYTRMSELSRANDILELLGNCEEGLRSRSDRKKRQVLVARLQELFAKNEWNIRDTELANKVGVWIAEYITDGNLASYSNFCRLKVMTHKNQPIYSMEEVQ